jgi:type II secretion system protein I
MRYLRNKITELPHPWGQSDQGFTLLEVLIAMAILVVSLASILSVESGSINATIKAKQMNIVSMLAKNLMIETEFKIKGKKFEEARKEETGVFEAPYETYSWKTTIKEIKFPEFSLPSQATAEGGTAATPAATGQNQFESQLAKLVSSYLSKAVREVTVTVLWKQPSGQQNYSVSTYWVNFENEFNISE